MTYQAAQDTIRMMDIPQVPCAVEGMEAGLCNLR
jgi:hypothetical protein